MVAPTSIDEHEVAAILELIGKQAIVDCYQRYCRGVDRLDEELMLSAFHDDAMIKDRTPREFFESLRAERDTLAACQHYVSNHVIEFDGDVAHVEMYYLVALTSILGT